MTDTKTPYGVVHWGGSCKDDYPNIKLYDQPPPGGAPVKLQAPALRAFRAAERRYGRFRPKKWRAIKLSGSWRSCAYQASLYAKDSHRYANPATSLHCRGLAIDVINPVPAGVHRALTYIGWVQARPDDEPWHYSWGVKA